MKKVAVILAPGFEEGETSTIVDIIRRAHIQCDMFGFDTITKGGHGIVVKSDKIFNDEIVDYDMIVLPGGYGGVAYMKDNKHLISILHKMNQKDKSIYAGLQGGSIMNEWTNDEKMMIVCCNDRTRPVIFKIERIDE